MIPDLFVKQFEVDAERFEFGGKLPLWLAPGGMLTSTFSIVVDVAIIGGAFILSLGCALTFNGDDFWKAMKICQHSSRDIGYSLTNIFSLGIYGVWKSNLNNPSWKSINDSLRPYIDIDTRAKHERENVLTCIILEDTYVKDLGTGTYTDHNYTYSENEVAAVVVSLMTEFANSEDLTQIENNTIRNERKEAYKAVVKMIPEVYKQKEAYKAVVKMIPEVYEVSKLLDDMSVVGDQADAEDLFPNLNLSGEDGNRSVVNVDEDGKISPIKDDFTGLT